MSLTTIRSSGNEVFNGNTIDLKVSVMTYDYVRLTSVPERPAKWQLPEADSVGFKAPVINLEGLFDASVSHGTNEAGSKIDWNFLNELVAASGPKYFHDDTIIGPTGSEILVEIAKIQVPQVAKNTPAPNIRSETQKYTMQLFVISGTVWFTGTGIIQT